MTSQELNEYYDYLNEVVGVSEDTLRVVTSINGYNEDTLNAILYAVTGYRDLEQFKDEQ